MSCHVATLKDLHARLLTLAVDQPLTTCVGVKKFADLLLDFEEDDQGRWVALLLVCSGTRDVAQAGALAAEAAYALRELPDDTPLVLVGPDDARWKVLMGGPDLYAA